MRRVTGDLGKALWTANGGHPTKSYPKWGSRGGRGGWINPSPKGMKISMISDIYDI